MQTVYGNKIYTQQNLSKQYEKSLCKLCHRVNFVPV